MAYQLLFSGNRITVRCTSGKDAHMRQNNDGSWLVDEDPDRRTGKSVFAFWEVPAGQPKALRAWFYPGEEFGQEFAYPKGEVFSLTANNIGATVPTYVETYDDGC